MQKRLKWKINPLSPRRATGCTRDPWVISFRKSQVALDTRGWPGTHWFWCSVELELFHVLPSDKISFDCDAPGQKLDC